MKKAEYTMQLFRDLARYFYVTGQNKVYYWLTITMEYPMKASRSTCNGLRNPILSMIFLREST